VRCVIVESEHESKSKNILKNLLGRNIDLDELVIAGLIFLLLSQRKGQDKDREKEKGSSLLKLDGIKDILGKMADNDILILMLIYLLL
jgi:hypothetical protein